MSDFEKRNYLRWDNPSVENKPENEDEDIQNIIEQINTMQKTQYNSHRHCYGGTHARTQGVVIGTLKTEFNLPTHLKQSLFAEEREWPVIARYSSEPGDPGLDDRISSPRGFAMKVFDVHGEFFDAGKDIPTQDIEFNSAPVIELADAKTTKEIFDLRIKFGNDKSELYKHLEARSDTELQKARDQLPVTHLESTRFYSQTAYRYGDYVIKYRIVPNGDTQRKLSEETVKSTDGSDILHRWLQNFFKEHDAEYLFQVQLCENLEDQPVEYAGKEWDSEKYPWQTVARLTFPKQDSFIYALKNFWEDRLRVDPWLGLKSLQPLGSPNRLRKALYPASSALRRKINSTTEIHIKSLDELITRALNNDS